MISFQLISGLCFGLEHVDLREFECGLLWGINLDVGILRIQYVKEDPEWDDLA